MPRLQQNFLFNEETVRLLDECSRVSGLTKTQIVELSIAQFATQQVELAQEAEKLYVALVRKKLREADGKK